MKKILLDTNFLMVPAQFGVDIFAEIRRICFFSYQLIVLDATVKELQKLALSKGRKGAHAKIALSLVKAKSVHVHPTSKAIHTDDLILESAGRDWIVATQDIKLKQRLRERGVSIITLRQKKYLILVD